MLFSGISMGKIPWIKLNITYTICGSQLFRTASFITHHLPQDSLANKITGNFKFFQCLFIYLFTYFIFIYLPVFIYLYSLKLSVFDLQPAPATCKLHPPSELRNSKCKCWAFLFISTNIWISCQLHRVCLGQTTDKSVCECKCWLIFVLPP